MIERDTVRYHSDFFPGSMSKVTLSWGGSSSVEADVVNYSSHGVRVVIPSWHDIPRKGDSVRMRINQIWFKGMCIFAASGQGEALSMGLYFYDPKEQNQLRSLLWQYLKDCSRPFPFVSHEWEEFVYKVCNSDDRKPKEIGHRKKDMVMSKRKSLNK